ncbi:hypothetical protein SAMN02745171_01328 [Porphyromonas circumdentaria]|uniref:Uncharacterized protein n=1 Tax=Porphyromonas circumdentaria TaxID=29524 RepID=A0A1T4P4W3_9PORP|nr:hypothetical protein [Porphyromonas circumdentaria]SJZ86441.1 hypothetical protein SAMN02745171_01328 [Porphyromonas circumdentaria]
MAKTEYRKKRGSDELLGNALTTKSDITLRDRIKIFSVTIIADVCTVRIKNRATAFFKQLPYRDSLNYIVNNLPYKGNSY